MGAAGNAPGLREHRLARAITVAVAVQQPLTILGIHGLLRDEREIDLVGEASTPAEAHALARQLSPDVMIIDLDLPSGGGLELVEALAQSAAPTRLVVLASRIGNDDFLRVRRLGVTGVFLKSMPTHLLLQAIRTVHAGGEFLEKNVLLEAFSTLLKSATVAKIGGEGLTQREQAIMDLVVAGMSNSVIAGELRIKEGTVKTHVHRIYDKLGLHSRFQLMAYTRSAGSS